LREQLQESETRIRRAARTQSRFINSLSLIAN
jgi:hypothetical protein